MVNGKKLNQIIIKILKKNDLNTKHATNCSKTVINTELVGENNHGLSRIKMKFDRRTKKVIKQKTIKFFLTACSA